MPSLRVLRLSPRTLNHPNTVRDLTAIDQNAWKREILNSPAAKRYRLDFYTSYDGSQRYGIVPTDNVHMYSNPMPSASLAKRSSAVVAKPRKQIALNMLLFLAISGHLILIAIYHTNHKDTGFERFMDIQGFGPRFLLTNIGILSKSQWTRLERRNVVYQPFRRLHNTHAPPNPQTNILAPRTLLPISTLFATFRHRSVKVALSAFTAILAEVLIIALQGIPIDAGQIYLASRMTRWICFAILGITLLVVVAVGVKKELALPHDPNTLGAMAMYVAESQMAEDMAELGTATGRELKTQVEGWRRRYELKKVGRDGGEWGVVDFEEGEMEA